MIKAVEVERIKTILQKIFSTDCCEINGFYQLLTPIANAYALYFFRNIYFTIY